VLLVASGCSRGDQPQPPSGPQPTILLAQAQFTETTDENGKVQSTPGAARLVILRERGDRWQREVLEDPGSNVFHKAVFFQDPADATRGLGILTIGANAAAAKLWHYSGDQWTAETLWKTTFGGTWDRLRDFEIGDVTGDGQPDIVIATHDQGVIAVLTRSAAGWKATEIDRRPGIWVHEVELGDLDGDGKLEIYATPSNPNRFDAEQPGEIAVYRRTADGFEHQAVEKFQYRHVKEILVTDLGAGGHPVLLASIEAEFGRREDAPPDADKTLIRRYRFQAGQYVGETVCTLPGGLCRFLNAGDVDGDGNAELIASTYKSGIWLARPRPGQWQTELIDNTSSSFEHATALADLDGDGTLEIYVAADDQGQLRRYHWTGNRWQHETLAEIEDNKLTFCVTVGGF
jgi:hypothetical protein